MTHGDAREARPLSSIADLLDELEIDDRWVRSRACRWVRQVEYQEHTGTSVSGVPAPLVGRLTLDRCDLPFLCQGDDAASSSLATASLGPWGQSILNLVQYYRKLPEATARGWRLRRDRVLSAEFHHFHSCLAELALHRFLSQRPGMEVRFLDDAGRGGPDFLVSVNGTDWNAELKSHLADILTEPTRAATDVIPGTGLGSVGPDPRRISKICKRVRDALTQMPVGPRAVVFVEVTGCYDLSLDFALTRVFGSPHKDHWLQALQTRLQPLNRIGAVIVLVHLATRAYDVATVEVMPPLG